MSQASGKTFPVCRSSISVSVSQPRLISGLEESLYKGGESVKRGAKIKVTIVERGGINR